MNQNETVEHVAMEPRQGDRAPRQGWQKWEKDMASISKLVWEHVLEWEQFRREFRRQVDDPGYAKDARESEDPLGGIHANMQDTAKMIHRQMEELLDGPDAKGRGEASDSDDSFEFVAGETGRTCRRTSANCRCPVCKARYAVYKSIGPVGGVGRHPDDDSSGMTPSHRSSEAGSASGVIEDVPGTFSSDGIEELHPQLIVGSDDET